MKKVLIIGNYKQSFGGISGQIDILLKKNNFENSIKTDLFNTKVSLFNKIFLPFKLLIIGSKYNIFHIHGCSFRGFYPIIIGLLIGKFLKKRTIVTYHGGGLIDFLNQYLRLCKYFFAKADVITVPSKFLLDVMIEKKINHNTIMLPNIITTTNVPFKKRDKIDPNLVVTRSLEDVYNISLVIQAFSKIITKYPNASLRIVGDGSKMKNLQEEVHFKKLKNVIFTGRVKNSKIGNELNKSDIFVNPTTKDSFSVSMFEAFACGLPVVSTNVGAIPDFLIDGQNGFLIESGDVEGLVNKIEHILNNQENNKTIINNAYSLFQKYTWNNLKDQYLDLYN